MKELNLYTDGGAIGNPGPAGVGMVIKDKEGKVLEKVGKRIGETTNNVAEYQALIEGLKLAQKYKPKKIICHLDSKLAVEQLTGRYKLRSPHLRELLFQVYTLSQKFEKAEFKYIPRTLNQEADSLVKEALKK